MTTFHVRPARAEDIEAVVELAVEMVLASRSDLRPEVSDLAILRCRRHNLSQLGEILELPEGGLFVAVDEQDQPIGHVIVLGNNVDTVTDLPQAWVYDLSVRRDWWGRGVGEKLMQTAEQFAASLGLEWIGLGVTSSNQRALSFYQKIGYRTERFQMAKRLEKNLDC
jgi:ribosomal protein S18 acetylase RimI-like enzyme